ncbi:MAG: integral rane sensor signal transduction histidine kinase [Caulobacteraceae bacterium]|nr:integral rane sensor signal transduction histidine kinase [Caulobacteraceae bacterium]
MVLGWSLGWLVALAGVAAALWVGFPALPDPVLLALGLAALPAVPSLFLARRAGRTGRSLVLMLWAAGGAGACALTGGLSGPLSPWCLAPVAFATLFGRSRWMAEAAALSVLGAAVAALAQVSGLEPAPPPEPLRFALSLSALICLGLAVAWGVVRSGRGAALQDGLRGDAERLLSEQPHLVLALDGDGKVTSAFGFAPHGLKQQALLEQGLAGAVAEEDRPRLAEALAAAADGGHAEVMLAPAGEVERVLALSLRRAADGRLFGVLRDAAQQNARETRLQEAKAAAEALNTGKSRFLANMSHELRTPLNTIMGFSDIMRARLFGPLPTKYAEYADLIHESGRHLLDLINDLLDVSKIEAERFQLQVETLDAREPVSAALRLMRVQADDAGLSLRATLPPEPLEIEADPRALKQIVLNLLSNALKFTPRGGQVTLTLTALGDALELTVVDTGMGIAPEDLKRLGRPFEQAGDAGQRARGTGLGLSLVRGFAELHGGEMIIESTLGEGTSVLVRLPGLVLGEDVENRPSAQVIAFNPFR